MTPFMMRVQEALAGRAPDRLDTEPSRDTPVAVAADAHVHVRSLAEQLVAEANAVLPGHRPVITLIDVPDPDCLAFTLTCGERSARVEAVLHGRTALARITAPGVSDAEPRQLTDEKQVETLVLTLITGDLHTLTH